MKALARLVLQCLVLVSLAFASWGCGEHELPPDIYRSAVPLAEVPENVLGAAKKQLPDVEFAEAWKNVNPKGELHSYEIKGRTKIGKIREVRVGLKGEILEME